MALVYPLLRPRRILAAACGRFLTLEAEFLCLAYVGELEFREILDNDELGPPQSVPLPGVVRSLAILEGHPQRIAVLLSDGSVHVLAYKHGEIKETHHFFASQSTKALLPCLHTTKTAIVAPTSLRSLFIGDIGNQGLWFTAPLTDLVLNAVFVESRLLAVASLTVQRSTSLSFHRIKVQSKSLGPALRTVEIPDAEPLNISVVEGCVVLTYRLSVAVVTSSASFVSRAPEEIEACEHLGGTRFFWVHSSGGVSEASVNLENGGLSSRILWNSPISPTDVLIVAAGSNRVFMQIPGGNTALARIERQGLTFTYSLPGIKNKPSVIRQFVDDNGASTLYCGGYPNDPMVYESITFGAKAAVQEPLDYTKGLTGVWNLGNGLYAVSSAQKTRVLAYRDGTLRPLEFSGWILDEPTLTAADSIQVTPSHIVFEGRKHDLPHIARFACISGNTITVAYIRGAETLVQWLTIRDGMSVRLEKQYPGVVTALAPNVVCCNHRMYIDDREEDILSLATSVCVDEGTIYLGLVNGNVIAYSALYLIQEFIFDVGRGISPRLFRLGDGRILASGEKTIALSQQYGTEISQCPPILMAASLDVGSFHLIITQDGMHVCEFDEWDSVSVETHSGVPGNTLDVDPDGKLWSAAGYLVRYDDKVSRLDFSHSINTIYALQGGNALYVTANEIGILNSSFERVDESEITGFLQVCRSDDLTFLVMHPDGLFAVEITIDPLKLHVGGNLVHTVFNFDRCDVLGSVILCREDREVCTVWDWRDPSLDGYECYIDSRDEPPVAALFPQESWFLIIGEDQTLNTFSGDSKVSKFVLGDTVSAMCRPVSACIMASEETILKPSLFYATENGGLYLHALLDYEVIEPLRRLQNVIASKSCLLTKTVHSDFQGFTNNGKSPDIDGYLLHSFLGLAQNVREEMCQEAGVQPWLIWSIVEGLRTILH